MYYDGYCFCRDYVIACILYDSCNFCIIYFFNVDNSNIIKHEINHLLLPFIYIVLWRFSVCKIVIVRLQL